jgi:hypothetical protein
MSTDNNQPGNNEPGNNEPGFTTERPYFDFFSLDEAKAIITGLMMIYQMGQMISMNADTEAEQDEADEKVAIIKGLLRRLKKQVQLDLEKDDECGNPFCSGDHDHDHDHDND